MELLELQGSSRGWVTSNQFQQIITIIGQNNHGDVGFRKHRTLK